MLIGYDFRYPVPLLRASISFQRIDLHQTE